MVKTLPISEAREQLRALVEQANRTMTRVIITRNGKPEAVLMGYAEYESWLETLDVMADHDELAAIEAGLADVRAGRLVSAEDAYREAAPPKDTPLEGPGNIGSGGLTEREVTVLHRIAAGSLENEIAHDLRLAPKTIHALKMSIFRKLGIRTHLEARHDTVQKRKADKVGR